MDDPDSPKPATSKRRLDSPTNVSPKSSESIVEPMSFSQQPADKRRSISPTNISLKSNESIVEPFSFSREPGGKRRSTSPTNISLKSNESIVEPFSFSRQPGGKRRSTSPTNISLKSNESIVEPFSFSRQPGGKRRSISPTNISLKSNESIVEPFSFSREPGGKRRSTSPTNISLKSNESIVEPFSFSRQPGGKRAKDELVDKPKPAHVTSAGVLEIEEMEVKLCKRHHVALTMLCRMDKTFICKDCAKQEHSKHEKQYMKVATVPDTKTTVQNVLDSMTASAFREFKRNLCHDYPECFETLPFDCSTQHVAETLMRSFPEEEILKVTLQLAAVKKMVQIQEKMKEKFRRKFQHIHEGLALPKTQTVLHDIYTELYITEGGSDAVQNEHEVRQIEKATKNSTMQETPVELKSIFKSSPEEKDYNRLVLTKGVAGIGKTVSVQKFILDWAENKENQDIDLILPLFFRDLNLEKGHDLSLMGLLQRYFPELRNIETIENGIKILLILDGLDECRLPLDFQNARLCTDIRESTSMDVILTNLIKGNLLPNALLWITSRPAAINQIPSECIQRVTEVRGFKDPQKQEYFRKKCMDPDLANEIIKIVKSSRSMQIMCHIPIFCWITATVLDILIRDSELGEIPKNQTQLYIHFLLIQIGLKNRKYHRAMNEDLRKLTEFDKDMILHLAKIAFLELEKGNLVFYEDDLRDAGITISDASEFSSLCTQLFRQEFGLYEQKVFCFLHLSVQEHLAAIHVLYTYLSEGINVLASHGRGGTQETTLTDVLKSAVNKALKSENGHFDQFLCFLVGLSTESNQKLLRGLLPQTRKEPYTDEIVKYINDKICKENRKETEIINLFHCLNEMGCNSMVKDIQEILQPDGRCDKQLNIAQCSALAYVLLMSEDVIEVFDLKQYKTDASGRQRLLPVIRASKKAILSRCGLSGKACRSLASALRTVNSPVRELDLSHNNIGDTGVQSICESLKSPHCQLEILSLAACKITGKSCESLVSALESAECRLTELDLSSNDLTNAGTKKLEPWLTQERCTLRTLRLRQCQLTKHYCQSLAALTSSSTKQMKLDLSENDLNDPEALQK